MSSFLAVAGEIMGPKDDHILISEMCKYIILHGFADGMKRGFADGMKLMMLR